MQNAGCNSGMGILDAHARGLVLRSYEIGPRPDLDA
jgi:hypothetical protein